MRLASLGLLAALGASSAAAQPELSFRATCGELRDKLSTLKPEEQPLATIQVVGPLARLQSDGVVAYLTVCSPPDPQVLCVAYESGGRAVGDMVAVSGGLEPRGPDRFVLDPCLHVTPNAPG